MPDKCIVLLKDKYRPCLDVAQDGLRGLTLETASEIEIIKNNLENQGFNIIGNLSNLRDENHYYIAMVDYYKLLNEEKIRYISLPMISNKSYPWQKNGDLYNYLCSAFLLENLRKFPGGLFEVPDELFISEKDLI